MIVSDKVTRYLDEGEICVYMTKWEENALVMKETGILKMGRVPDIDFEIEVEDEDELREV